MGPTEDPWLERYANRKRISKGCYQVGPGGECLQGVCACVFSSSAEISKCENFDE
jgi:hypothetical protein